MGYAPAQEEDCTVWFAIPDSPGDWEGILGRRAGGDRVEIVGVPIFVYDLSLGDEVQVMRSGEGADVGRRVTSASGNVAFRAAFDESPRPDHHWRSLMADLSPQECWFDTWSETLIAISAPSGSAQAVADYLAQREQRGELTYETGRRSGGI